MPFVSSITVDNGEVTGLTISNVATTDVVNDAITYAKIQNVTSGKMLGRSTAGAGDVEEITVGSGLSLSGGTLSASGVGSGTVTSVALTAPTEISVSGSPITSSGTLALSWASQGANVVFASPPGASGTPTFRSLVTGDIPNLDTSKLTTGTLGITRGGTGSSSAPSNGQILIGNGSTFTLATITAGSGITVTNGTGSITIANNQIISVSDTATIDLTLASNVISADVIDGSITNAKLRNSVANSVIGRSAGTTGAVADIVAGSNGVLRESGGTLAFGSVDTANLANNAVTFAKFQQIATNKLLGRSTAATGNVEELSIGSGLSLSAGTLTATGTTYSVSDTSTIDLTLTGTTISGIVIDASITNAKIRDSAGLSVVGRSANSTGSVADITAASDYQILRRSGSSIAFGQIDLSQNNAVGSSVLGLANGGTGQTATPTSGQLLIGTGSGFLLNPLTGATGVKVTNGSGTIALSGDFAAGAGISLTGTSTVTIATALTGGTGITITGTGALTLALTSGIVSPSTYKSVTVDTYGRVTAGSNPTTLSGYGITDAVPSSRLVSTDTGLRGGADLSADRTIALAMSHYCQGRLTLTSGTAITTADVTGAGTIYWTYCNGGDVALYDGQKWNTYLLSEVGLSLTLTSGKNYDVFAWAGISTPSSTNTGTDVLTFPSAPGWPTGSLVRATTSGGGLTAGTDYWYNAASSTTGSLHATLANALAGTSKVDLTSSITSSLTGISLELSSAWTSDTARTDALTLINGVYCKNGDTLRRYLGTIRASGTNTTEDSLTKRFVWNLYNQVQRYLFTCPAYSDGNTSTTYTHSGASWAQVNSGTGSNLEFVVGLDGYSAEAFSCWSVNTSATGGGGVGIGYDSNSYACVGQTLASNTFYRGVSVPLLTGVDPADATKLKPVLAGYHYFSMLAFSSAGSATINADNARFGGSADVRMTFLYAKVNG